MKAKLVIILVVFISLFLNSKKIINYYYEQNKIEICGIIKHEIFYGPPNYGEDPENDSKEYYYILYLFEPINVINKSNNKYYETYYNVLKIQIINLVNLNLKVYKNKKVKIKGKLFSKQTGHHHTDVLIEISQVKYYLNKKVDFWLF